ncbi:hypothetical protein PDESU_06186 [Pontiella desulfatans]|uniref:Uncharacterized protein n=1 Tax=Pontiella desulfatans TaxID=2750659 RepID=A0A6C2UBP8_PONDE|nr:hypothetical protein [Pontiella desulfatans]VGO17588.1 hypothetical protein PDESU_06186 [Pontiella desulfatans]
MRIDKVQMMLPDGDELLPPKELADKIHCTPRLISAMRRDGFLMPAGLATANWALEWLSINPEFRQNKPMDGVANSIADYRITDGDELLDSKGIAARFGRNTGYVYAMKRDGFLMPGRRATLNHALAWLAANPDFRVNRAESTNPDPSIKRNHNQTDITEFYTDGIPVRGEIKSD